MDSKNDSSTKKSYAAHIVVVGSVIIALIIVIGTIWVVRSAQRDNEKAVRAVSVLYLNELAGRRELVIENNLQYKIRDLRVAVSLMTEEDLSDLEHLQSYQARMKKLYRLEKFAFVDTDGIIYTSLGLQDNIDEYAIDYINIDEPEISIFNLNTVEKKVVLAVPVDLMFGERHFNVCFMEIDMKEMLSGVSMEAGNNNTTFCNIYTHDGISLTENVLGGLAQEDNLIEAMKSAEFESGYSYERFLDEFGNGKRGEVSFTYNGIKETLSYVPVSDTGWNLTYLVRESVISENITNISNGMVTRGVIQSTVTVIAMGIMFLFVFSETRRSSRLRLETETAQAEVRGKQEELDKRTVLQKKLEQQSAALSNG